LGVGAIGVSCEVKKVVVEEDGGVDGVDGEVLPDPVWDIWRIPALRFTYFRGTRPRSSGLHN
jgi:hypothetical protein